MPIHRSHLERLPVWNELRPDLLLLRSLQER